METRTKEWLEGRKAFMDGETESECPYDMDRDWHRWCDWVCGHGEATHEEFLKSGEPATPQ